MKLTCLSKGHSYHFPPCHIVEIGGFRILLDCPLDLSALAVFSPVPAYSDRILQEAFDCTCHESLENNSQGPKRQKVENTIDASSLVHAVPWFKTVSNLHLWDISFVDAVLISSPMGMLGLPFFTRAKGFSAKIYATEAATKIGQLMMEDLVSMHREFIQFYGSEDSGCAQWMKWEELDKLPSLMQEIIAGKDGTQVGGWFALYSAADVKDCIQKVESLKYAEETCYGGSLNIKAFSSGLDIGTCNWVIKSPKRDVVLLSSSLLVSPQAMNFDYHALQDHDVILYSDFSSLNGSEGAEDEMNDSASMNENSQGPSVESLLNSDESLEEEEKLAFISSCAVDALRAGGSVLISIGRVGVLLQLLEQISSSQEFTTLKVPIFFISSVAAELLSFANIIPEWLCIQRQKKLFAGEPLFAHVNLVKEKRLHLLSSVCTPDLLNIWQEPCIVFTPHWSLRIGPVVHFLQRWRGNENSLLVLEKMPDADLALLPFKPLAMKVLECSFLSGIRLNKVAPLLEKLQPKCVLFPEDLRTVVGIPKATSFSVIYYGNDMLCVPSIKQSTELGISTDLASRFQWINFREEDISITRLKGELSMEHGKHWLLLGSDSNKTSIDLGTLSTVLHEKGIKTSTLQATSDGSCTTFVLKIEEPGKGLIEVQPTRIAISTSDKLLAARIFEYVDGIVTSM